MKYYPLFSEDNLPQTLILANGAFPTAPVPLALLDKWCAGEEGYSLICCDGAVNKLRRYTSLLPDAVVGDLDSVSPALKDLLGQRIHRFSDQDTNDLTKTMNFVHRSMGRRAITLLGASGGREDHILANLALLSSYAPLVDELIMLTDEGYFILITEPAEVEVLVGQQVSVFDFLGKPISLTGVRWPLEQHLLPQLWCGSLNCATEKTIHLTVDHPVLLYLANV